MNSYDAKTQPHHKDVRTCFAIAYFTNEADALAHADETKGATYNGGMFHGMACGRDASWDYTDKRDGVKYYATTY